MGHARLNGDVGILNIRVPTLPQFRFEWHPGKATIYLIRAASPTHGEAIATDIASHGAAQNAVLTWCRGFHEGSTPALGASPSH